jgi:AAA domain
VTWEPINLRHVPDEPPEPPDYLGLVYRGRRHWFSGPPESLKTLVAYAVVLAATRIGERLALIDFEMGQRDARNRLREMGTTDDEFDLIEFYEPDTAPTKEILQGIADRCTLVVIDAAAGAYQMYGLDENRDAEKFNAAMPDVLWKAGATTITLDHVVKNPDNRGMWASGHHRKIGGTEVHLGFEASKLERGGTAVTRITAHKDRPGFHRRGKGNAGAVEFRSDPNTHALSWERKADGEATASEWRGPTIYMEKISRYLEQNGPTSRSRIYLEVPGNRQRKVDAAQHLLAEKYVDLDESRSRLRSVRPFRHEEPGSLVPKPFPTVPDSASTPGSARSPAYKAGTGNGELGDEEPERLEAIGDEMGLT